MEYARQDGQCDREYPWQKRPKTLKRVKYIIPRRGCSPPTRFDFLLQTVRAFEPALFTPRPTFRTTLRHFRTPPTTLGRPIPRLFTPTRGFRTGWGCFRRGDTWFRSPHLRP